MTGRILRTELRRSSAVGVGLLVLVLGTGLMLSFPQGFAGRWMQLAASARSLLVVLWPIALAGGAWLGRRDGRNRVGELFASTVRPRWQRTLPAAAALAVTVVTGYSLMVLISAAWVAPTAGYFPPAAPAFATVGALSLVAAAWLGMAAGRAVPRLVTAPVLAVAGVAVAGLLPEWKSLPPEVSGGRPIPAALLLTPVYTGTLHDFQTITARTDLIQASWLAALAVTGLLLLGAASRRAIALAVLPAALGAAVTVPLMPTGGYNATVVTDPVAVELVCDNDGPQVCTTRVHAALLPDVAGPARQALAVLAAKLPDAPTRAEENRRPDSWIARLSDLPRTRNPADTLVFDVPSIGPTGHADLTDGSLLPQLLAAAWQQKCGDAPNPVVLLLAQAVVTAWLSDQPLLAASWWTPEQRARAEHAHQLLAGLPQSDQQRRVAASRDAALACRSDAVLAVLTGDAA